MLRAPNRNALGILNSSSGQFTYQDSLDYERSNALAINARQRMHRAYRCRRHTHIHTPSTMHPRWVAAASRLRRTIRTWARKEKNSLHAVRAETPISVPYSRHSDEPRLPQQGRLPRKGAHGYSISGRSRLRRAHSPRQLTGAHRRRSPPERAARPRPNRVAGQSIKGAGTRLAWFNAAAFLHDLRQARTATRRATRLSCRARSPSTDRFRGQSPLARRAAWTSRRVPHPRRRAARADRELISCRTGRPGKI